MTLVTDDIAVNIVHLDLPDAGLVRLQPVSCSATSLPCEMGHQSLKQLKVVLGEKQTFIRSGSTGGGERGGRA